MSRNCSYGPSSAARSDLDVCGQAGTSHQLGEGAEPVASDEIHLEEAVAGRHEALGAGQIRSRDGVDVREVELGAHDVHGLLQAGQVPRRGLGHLLEGIGRRRLLLGAGKQCAVEEQQDESRDGAIQHGGDYSGGWR